MKKLAIFPVFIIALLAAGILFYVNSKGVFTNTYPTPDGNETVDSIQIKFTNHVNERLRKNLRKSGFKEFPKKLAILIFKEEQIMEVYGIKNQTPVLIKTYPFTAFSGRIGPKLREGDKQIPEGLYQIEYLNPNSSYHLSAKVSYPNDFDKQKALQENRTNPGGDIFIHGKNFTIGCVPIGDKGIEEVFILMSYAFKNGIEVIISPKDFRRDNTYPEVSDISWEQELYQQLEKRLEQFDF